MRGGQSIDEQAVEYVDIHAVLLIDVSSSMTDEQIERIRDGVRKYLFSDESQIDYSVGSKKAITVVNFAGGTNTMETHVISTLEEAKNFVDGYVYRIEAAPCMDECKEDIKLSDGERLGDSTMIFMGLEQVRHAFESEADVGIVSENRRAIVVSDYKFSQDVNVLRGKSNELTNDLGVQVCSIVVEPKGVDVNALTHSALFTVQKANVEREDGFTSIVLPCVSEKAKTPDELGRQVSFILAMPRI